MRIRHLKQEKNYIDKWTEWAIRLLSPDNEWSGEWPGSMWK